MPTIATTRYTATLDHLGTCEVSGPDALLIVQQHDNAADHAAQRELRARIQQRFYDMEPGTLYPNHVVIRWTSC